MKSAVTIGFDIGGTKLLGACDRDGKLSDILQCPTPRDREALLSTLSVAVEDFGGAAGVGIGVAGATGRDGTLWCPNIPCLTGVDLERLLAVRLGLPVQVENDAHAALRGELWQGVLRGVCHGAVVSVGTGVGAAVVLDGRILEGRHGAAGAAGWLWMGAEASGPARLEEMASGTGLCCMAQKAGFADGRALFQAVRDGGRAALRVLEEWATVLGTGLASLVSLFDLEVVALSGGLVQDFELYADPLRRALYTGVSPLNSDVRLYPSALKEKACLYGAVRLGREAAEFKR